MWPSHDFRSSISVSKSIICLACLFGIAQVFQPSYEVGYVVFHVVPHHPSRPRFGHGTVTERSNVNYKYRSADPADSPRV